MSVQITVVEPSVSTAESLRTMTLRFAMRCIPSESTIVVIAVSPSGTAATPSATASSSTPTSAAAVIALSGEQRRRYDDRDGDDRDAEHLAGAVELALERRALRLGLPQRAAMWPISVAQPVAVTIARPRP